MNGLAKEFNADLNVVGYGNMKLILSDEDNNIIYESPIIKDGMAVYHVKVNVANLLQLKIQVIQTVQRRDLGMNFYDKLAIENMSILTTDY